MSAAKHYDDLNLISLLREIWQAKVFLFLGLIVGSLIAFGFISISEPQFEARMMIGPAEPLDISVQAGFQDGQSSYVLPPDRALSPEIVSNFVRFEAMMRGVSVSRLLLRDETIQAGIKNHRAFIFEESRESFQPAELAKHIARRVKFDRFGETALKEIVYSHPDRAFAAYFLQQIHRVTDQLIRAELRNTVDERIAYLERVLGKTTNPEQRRIVTNLLLEQERARMTVSMDSPVAAAIIEPAASGVRSVWPDYALIYSGFGFLGLLIGYLTFGVVQYQKREVFLKNEMLKRRQHNMSGEDLQHKPQRPLKYGRWFQNAPDNDVSENVSRPNPRDTSNAAE